MRSIGLVLLGALTACATTSSPTVLVHTDSSPVASFANYRTFGFGLAGAPPAPLRESARSFTVERGVRSLVAAELVRKGYVEQPTNPDFVVTFASGYTTEDFFMGEPPLFGPAEIGAIVIDAFDASSAAHVWHGTGETEVSPGKVNDQLLQVGVHRVLGSFPVRGAEGLSSAPAGDGQHSGRISAGMAVLGAGGERHMDRPQGLVRNRDRGARVSTSRVEPVKPASEDGATSA
jgi:hypothetical protein